MPMDFSARQNKYSYAGREADDVWARAMLALVDPRGQRIVDLGCGGGIYLRAWQRLGAASVVGVDASPVMLEAARETCAGLPGISFVQADAGATLLPAASTEIVFSRAVLHHMPGWPRLLAEAHRLLAPGGIVIAQDKTPDDLRHSPSPAYLGGYFYQLFPRLREIEDRRRPRGPDVLRALADAGFRDVTERALTEPDRTHASPAALADYLRARTGRSIAHELSDAELEQVVRHVLAQVPAQGPITEVVYWTIWTGRR